MRSPNAHKAHTVIIGYILKQQNEIQVSEAINLLDEHSLLESSTHGYTHFLDALHLPFKLASPEEARDMALFLARTLLVKATSINPFCVVTLLTQASKHDLNPLHQILASASPLLLAFYLAALDNARNQHWISKELVSAVLVAVINGRFSPLHSALLAGNAHNLQTYLTYVEHAVVEEWVSKESFKTLLLSSSGFNSTPLHFALKSEQTESFPIYLAEVEKAVKQGWISQEEYIELLLSCDDQGVTALYRLLISSSFCNLALYFSALNALVYQSPNALKAYRLLILTNLHPALLSRDFEKINAFFTEVYHLMQQGHITPAAYTQFLLSPNPAGFTPLHQAANSNSIEIVQFFLNELKKALAPHHYSTALWAKSARGNLLPLCESQKSNAEEINRLFFEERRLNPRPNWPFFKPAFSVQGRHQQSSAEAPKRSRYPF
ncbi:MAG: hypothetical protein WC785_03705 [Tatlockia sp.]|jgi:ankyrin repeat protein